MSPISKLRGIFGLSVEPVEEPTQEFIDPVLGAMKWNEDEQYYLNEVNSLIVGLIHFHFYKNQPRIFAELEGGRDFRCWRIEYSGTKCEGMGFDN